MSHFIRSAILSLALLAPLSAHAEGTKLAVVNTQIVMKDSTAAKSMREQLESKQKAFQAEISKQEESLQKAKQELDKQQSAMAKEAFATKVKEFQGKVADWQKQAQSKKMTLDAAFEQSNAQLQKTVGDIVGDIAKEKGVNVVIPSGPLLFADPALDITTDVVKRLNEKMPSYTVKFEAPAAPKAPEKK